MATRCFTCKTVISNRYERYQQLMEEYAGDPNRRLRIFRELKATRECCQTRLVTYFDQESMMLSVPTHMFASAAPPYSRPNPEAQALVLEARIAQAEARMAKNRTKRPTAASAASSSFFDPELMHDGEASNGSSSHASGSSSSSSSTGKRKRSGRAALGAQSGGGAPAKRGRPRNDASASNKSQTKKTTVPGAVGRPRTKPLPASAASAAAATADAPAAVRAPRKYNKRSKVSSAIEKEVRAIMESCSNDVLGSTSAEQQPHGDASEQRGPSTARSTTLAVAASSSAGKEEAKEAKEQKKGKKTPAIATATEAVEGESPPQKRAKKTRHSQD
jgi:DNA-directed RNA polymerase subunit N (RpoN/RPB10)